MRPRAKNAMHHLSEFDSFDVYCVSARTFGGCSYGAPNGGEDCLRWLSATGGEVSLDVWAARRLVTCGLPHVWLDGWDPKTNPMGSKLCPQTAAALSSILQPTYAWGPPPNYTKCDATTGLLPTAQVEGAQLARS